MTDAIKSFSPIRMTAATEDAAINQALQIVGVAREDVSVEVLAQDAKGVTVRLSPRKDGTRETAATETSSTRLADAQAPDEQAPDAQLSNPESLAQKQPEIYMSANEPSEKVADAMEVAVPVESSLDETTSEMAAQENVDELKVVENLQDVLPTLPANEPAIEAASKVETEVVADEESQERARAMAQQILERMGMEAQATLISAPAGSGSSDVPRIYLQIDGEDVGILIGKHGQTLQSFQYLLNVTLNNRGEESEGSHFRVSVDAGGYRARRGDALQQMALDAAERAKRDRRSIRLEPMPAHERRLVHMALQSDDTISTSSEGREPLRHVVVIPAGARPASPSGGRPNGSFGGRDNGGRDNNRGDSGGRSRESNNRGGYRGSR